MVEAELEEGEMVEAEPEEGELLENQQEGFHLYSTEEEEGNVNRRRIQEKIMEEEVKVTEEEEKHFPILDPDQEGLSEAAYDHWT